VAAVPAIHDIYEIGFVVKGAGHSVYFAGDSRLHPDLPAIAERHAPDVAILSVDGTRLLGSKDLWVMTPEDAVQAAQILKVKAVMPSHADTWFSDTLVRDLRLAYDVPDAKPKFMRLMASMLPGVRAINPEPGGRAAL
jgi:L-ascorbate metabolism protein UlaG (beta-lactamase superfamily)